MLSPSRPRNIHSARATARVKRHDRRRASLRAVKLRPGLDALEDRKVPAFLAPVDYAVGYTALALQVGDFNGDDRLDVATANVRGVNEDLNTVSVLRSNGDGTFQPARSSPAFSFSASQAVADFNGDGLDDLATSDQNDAGHDVNVLLSRGDGTFHAPVNIDVGPILSTNTHVATGDFNGDGKPDLAVIGDVDFYDYSYIVGVHVLLGSGDGSFSGPIASVFAYNPFEDDYSAFVGDFNGDGNADMLVNSYNGGALLLGDGQGRLTGQGWNSTIGAAAVGDVNGDGKLDLVRAGSVLLGDGAGGFPIRRNYDTGGDYGPIALGDFNRDGRLDIAMRPWESDNVLIFRGRGDGTFGDAESFAVARNDDPGIAVGDFNRDGWLDVATLSLGGVSVLINDRTWPALPPAISVGDATVTEGNTGTRTATFVVTLSDPSAQPVTVQYATANGTATAGGDYQARSGTLTFAPGETSKTITVPVLGDRLAEPDEAFVVNLSGATGATIADGQAVGTITDDEPRISISDATKAEGKNKQTTLFTFTVTLSAPYDQPVTMSFSTLDGTATNRDKDYVARAGTLTFAPGETTKTITIEVKGDNRREANEYFYLDLSGNSSNSLFTKKRGIGTILNDD